MRKVFVDDLPRGGSGINKMVNKNSINWSDSVGYKIKFIYDDITGKLEILKYDKKKRMLLMGHGNITREIRTPQLLRGEIGGILGTKVNDYRFDKDEIVKTLTGSIKILEQKRKRINSGFNIKSYKYKCLNDNYIGNMDEELLKNGVGCPVCSNKKVVKGINDISTTHPHLVRYFVNIEDTNKYSYGSNKKLKLKCPNCGNEKEMSPQLLNRQGLGCNKCSDGISYPEKFMFNVLTQLSIKFEVQKVFEWAKNKKYDFYIPVLNMIIETHGLQHYEDKIEIYGKNVEEEQSNDELKENIAKINGVATYIVIDCRYSELNFICSSIQNSELKNMFDLSKIDWLKCHEFSCSSRVKEASDIWMAGIKNTREISVIMKIARTNINKYLKKGKELGWNDYNPKKESRNNGLMVSKLNGKKVEIFKSGISQGVYNSIKELIIAYEKEQNIKFTQPQISEVCNGNRKLHKGYYFRFV